MVEKSFYVALGAFVIIAIGGILLLQNMHRECEATKVVEAKVYVVATTKTSDGETCQLEEVRTVTSCMKYGQRSRLAEELFLRRLSCRSKAE